MPDVKVINLKRSGERRAEFARVNTGLVYEFFEAVDGLALSPEEIQATGLFDPALSYTPGRYGCALSHARLWDEVIATDKPLTVAEDDAIFRDDFAPLHERLLAQAAADWDLVLWGWNFDSAVAFNVMRGVSPNLILFNQEALRQGIGTFKAATESPCLLPLDKAFGTIAYSISAAGARKFKSLCFPMGNFQFRMGLAHHIFQNTGIDTAMSRIYAATNSLVSFPPLVVTRNINQDSTTLPR